LQAKQKAARDARYAARKSRPKRRSVRPLHGRGWVLNAAV
jgi:hypothetical protein